MARRALNDARSGQPQLVVISGEPGIGKSRLVRELQRTATTRGVEVSPSRCREHLDLPYLPFTNSLLPHCSSLHAKTRRSAGTGPSSSACSAATRAAPTPPTKHPLYARLAYAAPGPARRRALHLAIARGFEERGDGSILEIAHHLIEAGSAATPRERLEYTTAPGTVAQRGWFAYLADLALLVDVDLPLDRIERGLVRAAEDGMVITDGPVVLVPRVRGALARRQGRLEDADLLLRQAIEVARSRGLRSEAGRASLELAQLLAEDATASAPASSLVKREPSSTSSTCRCSNSGRLRWTNGCRDESPSARPTPQHAPGWTHA
jgi:hypothetical protein